MQPSADEVIRTAWAALDTTDAGRRAFERFKPTRALLQRAAEQHASGDLHAELENECRLFAPIGAGSPLVPIDRYAPQLRADSAVPFLKRRMESGSAMARAFAGRLLWLTSRAKHPMSGATCAQAFVDWFHSAATKAISDGSDGWCIEALEVLGAAIQMSVEANHKLLLKQLATDTVELAEKLPPGGLGRWVLECGEALLLLRKKGLSADGAARVSRLLHQEADAYRERGNWHLQRRFIGVDVDLRRAASLDEDARYGAMAIAASFEQQGDAAPTPFSKVEAYRHAVAAFRDVPAPQADQHRVLAKLEAATAAMPSEMRRHQVSVEVPTAEIEKYLGVYDKLPIEQALRALCVDVNLRLDPSELRARVTDQSGKYIFMALAHPVMLRPDGTTYVPTDEAAVFEFRVAEQARLHIETRWQLSLGPILQRLRLRGLTTEHVIAKLLESNVFDASDRPFFQRAVGFWIERDHLSAVHVAVPRIEYLLRRLCRRLGRPTINVRDVGNQQIPIESTLGVLMPSNEQLFYELRLLLADQAGYALRHIVAHGLAEAEAYNACISDTLMLLLVRLSSLTIGPSAPRDEDAGDVGAQGQPPTAD